MILRICGIFLLLLNFSCSDKSFLREGLLFERIRFDSNGDSAIHDIPIPLEFKIWFRDSVVIYEVRVFKENSDHTDTGTIYSISQEVLKYTYLDLRNFQCQDYLTFSDTATPFFNYFLKPNEQVSWKFYRAKELFDSIGVLISMGDTTTDNKNNKRLMLLNSQANLECLYYLDCQSKNNLFHINRWLDEKFCPCQVVKSERRYDLNSSSKEVFEIRIQENSLNQNEKKIFKRWTENAAATQLPLKTADEAMKMLNDLTGDSSDSSFDLREKN